VRLGSDILHIVYCMLYCITALRTAHYMVPTSHFNNCRTTGPNGVSEFILTAHVVPVVTTRHSPAERREREPKTMPPFTHFRRSPTPARRC
jgi:hypothetical protein